MIDGPPPKAGFSFLGKRFEAAFLYRLKQRTDHPRAIISHQLRRMWPASLLVNAVTLAATVETRQRWRRRGWLQRLDPLLAHGRLRIPYGLAEGMVISTADLDLAGAQTYLVTRGSFELHVQSALRRTLGPGSVFYDIGANIGFLSLVASRLVGDGGQVVCVDPEARNTAAIRTNAGLNGLGNIIAIEGAATFERGPVEVLAVQDTLWTRLAVVGPHPLERERITVDGVVLDDLLDRAGVRPPDVIKIDVEGGEVLVLRGMARILRQHRPALIIEMHGKSAEVATLLEAAGYMIENLDGPESVAAAGGNIHVLARHRQGP